MGYGYFGYRGYNKLGTFLIDFPKFLQGEKGENSVNNKNLKWTIIGGGNGGQSVAGHLGLMGFSVKLYDIIPETVEKINEQGGIFLEGIVNGFGKVKLATNNMEKPLKIRILL